jgi:PRTRC genetic system ParB family protein
MQAIDVKVAGLKDEYQVIKIVKASDGFKPLYLKPDGDLGVGEAQYQSCKGCGSFGCAVSATPGSYGLVTTSLCFDVNCNTQKVATQRKAARQAEAASVTTQNSVKADTADTKSGKASTAKTGGKAAPTTQTAPQPTNKPSQRVLQHRVEQWRKWCANALMTQTERNQRLLIALALAGRMTDCRQIEYGAVLDKITGGNKNKGFSLNGALQLTGNLSSDLLPRLLQAVAASAAFGVDEPNLQLLLNYLDIDEAQHFVIDKEFLSLFTMNELESLASETGLRKAMGGRFDVVRKGKRDAFIAALLSLKNFTYKGTVPSVMRYVRKPLAIDGKPENDDAGSKQSGQAVTQQQAAPEEKAQSEAMAAA